MVLIQNPVQPLRGWYSDADNSRYNELDSITLTIVTNENAELLTECATWREARCFFLIYS